MKKQYLFSLLLYALVISANEPFDTIKPETATLQMDSGKMNIKMEKTSENNWKIESFIKVGGGIFSRTEQAVFAVNKRSIKPLIWSRKERILFNKKNYLVTFDWDNSKIIFDEDGDKGTIILLPDYLGPATGPLLLRLKLREAGLNNLPNEIVNNVYFKGEIKRRTFSVHDLEIVTTPLGEFEAIKVARVRSDEDPREQIFWFAPALDFSLIKIINDDGKQKRELIISAYNSN